MRNSGQTCAFIRSQFVDRLLLGLELLRLPRDERPEFRNMSFLLSFERVRLRPAARLGLRPTARAQKRE
jgi:hypothetical protein